MPLNPRPFHAAGGPRDGFREWFRHVGGPARARAPAPRQDVLGLDPGHPLLKLAAAAFVGYTLGRLVYRGSASKTKAGKSGKRPPAAAPRRPSRPAPAVRPRPPEREPRSSIRFR